MLGMKVIPALMATMLFSQFTATAETNATWRGQSVTQFSSQENEMFGWRIVNDGVMGGLSKGKMEMTGEGTMKFWGDLSTKNNGGFSMMTSQKVDLNLSNDLGLLVKVRGDGRAYTARLTTDARYRGMEVSFSADFKTKAGQWARAKIPFSDFRGSFRGMDLPKMKFDPAMVERVGILIGDKKDAPFNLEVASIETYGKGQGDFRERKMKSSKKTTAAGVSTKRLLATADADGRFTILGQALDAAKLTPFFQWDNPLTVFAPTDEAFSKLPEGMVEDLLKPENREKLVKILSYHVVTGATELSDALIAKSTKTIQGEPMKFRVAGGKVRVNEAVLIDADVKCADGIIHVVDTVLLPPSMRTVAMRSE